MFSYRGLVPSPFHSSVSLFRPFGFGFIRWKSYKKITEITTPDIHWKHEEIYSSGTPVPHVCNENETIIEIKEDDLRSLSSVCNLPQIVYPYSLEVEESNQ